MAPRCRFRTPSTLACRRPAGHPFRGGVGRFSDGAPHRRNRAEARTSRRRPGQLLLPGTVPTASPTCDRVEKLLGDKELLKIEDSPIARMVEILDRHGQVNVLSESRGVLQFHADRLQQAVGTRARVMTVLSGGADHRLQRDLFDADHLSFTKLERGEHAQDRFAIAGKRRSSGSLALFLTYEIAAGVNLQQAQALVLIDVTSNIRNMIQGLGRIDPIDSPHSAICAADVYQPPRLSLARLSGCGPRRRRGQPVRHPGAGLPCGTLAGADLDLLGEIARPDAADAFAELDGGPAARLEVAADRARALVRHPLRQVSGRQQRLPVFVPERLGHLGRALDPPDVLAPIGRSLAQARVLNAPGAQDLLRGRRRHLPVSRDRRERDDPRILLPSRLGV